MAAAGRASISRANYFEEQGIYTDFIYETIVPEVQSAINSGIFDPSPNPTFSCASGNCTWPTYSTVAWCSSCSDFSDRLLLTNTSHNTKYLPNYTLTTSLPGGISVNQSYTTYWDPIFHYAAMGPSPEFGAIDFILAKMHDRRLPSTKDLFPSCKNPADKNAWQCRGYGASSCSFFPCVKTFQGVVAGGQLSETVIGTSSNWDAGDNGGSMIDLDCLDARQLQALPDYGFHINDTQQFVPYHQIDNSLPSSLVPDECVYSWDITW